MTSMTFRQGARRPLRHRLPPRKPNLWEVPRPPTALKSILTARISAWNARVPHRGQVPSPETNPGPGHWSPCTSRTGKLDPSGVLWMEVTRGESSAALKKRMRAFMAGLDVRGERIERKLVVIWHFFAALPLASQDPPTQGSQPNRGRPLLRSRGWRRPTQNPNSPRTRRSESG